MAWSAAWLYRATNDSTYKADIEKHYTEFKLGAEIPQQFSWDDKRAGLHVLMAKLTGEQKYKDAAKDYADWLVNKAPKSPKGMVYLDQWGPLRHAANAAWITLQVNLFY